MQKLRSLTFAVVFYAWSVFVSLVILTPLLIAPRSWTAAVFGLWSRGIRFLLKVIAGIEVEVRGREFMPTTAALVAPKHQSMFDVFSQFSLLPDACFVTKKELLMIPFFGWFAMKATMISVDRGGHSTALRKLVRDAKDRFRIPRQLVIFPEGTRGDPGAPGDYKPGIAALYRELELPVYPMATNAGVHWSRKGFNLTPGVIVFEYLEPIPPGLKRGEFMRTLEERIEAATGKLLSADSAYRPPQAPAVAP
ncbi:lysophospholipid acyltransferase family protein [Phenylobacterium sp.]|uniref:lysophospholipid acyltransferase family protein n=1 Tax=Phenylobacterium sp. TaxID=1871053 RepID=UPI0030F462BC